MKDPKINIRFNHVITEKDIEKVPEGFKIKIVINKNNQIHDFQPRTFGGKYLFDAYHGRQGNKQVQALIYKAIELYKEEK